MALFPMALAMVFSGALQQPPAAAQPAPQTTPKPAPPAAEQSTALSGVTVTAAKPEVQTSIDRRSYSVGNDLQGQSGVIADVLRNIPSVQVDLSGNLSLRGQSGVTVLLDGLPSSQFKGDALAQALQSMPASRIDRIEVITNPSAAFSTDGAGIINLITKKATGEGATGSVQALVSHYGGARLNLVGGYNSNKLRLTADMVLAHQIQNQYSDNRRVPTDPSNPAAVASRETVSQEAIYDLAGGHVGAEYDLDAKTRLSGDLRVNYGDRNIDGVSHFEQQNASGAPVLEFDRTSPVGVILLAAAGSTTWRRRYAPGHDLTLNLSRDRQETSVGRSDERTTGIPAGVPQTDLRNLTSNFIDQTFIRADYNRPTADKSKLQLGYEMARVQGGFNNDAGQSALGAPVILNPALHDRFEARQMRNDAFVTYERPLGSLTALAGLRIQAVNLDLTQVTQHAAYVQNYANLYPTLHLGYDLEKGRQLTASYSRRVNRPIFAELNPFLTSSSPQSASRGNPRLTPENTDSFEAGYEYRQGPASFLATLYYRTTGNAMTTVGTDLGNGVLLAERANAGERRTSGLELVRTGRLTPKLTYNLSGNVYWSQIQAPGLGFPIDQSGTTGFGRANLTWQVTPKDLVQLNLFANGRVIYPQGYASPNASGNIGYRHKVNDKLSWLIVAQDPFGTQKNELVLDVPGGVIRRIGHTNSRLFSFSLVKNFGGGRPRDPTFDFAPGGSAGAGPL